MRAPLLACLALALASPAGAGEAPGAAFGAALAKAHASGLLASEVFPEQTFRVERGRKLKPGGRVGVVTLSAKQAKAELVFTQRVRYLGSSVDHQRIRIHYSLKGVLRQIELTEAGWFRKHVLLKISGTKWTKTVTRTRSSAKGGRAGAYGVRFKPKAAAGRWDPSWVPACMYLFVAPTLHALLPSDWAPRPVAPFPFKVGTLGKAPLGHRRGGVRAGAPTQGKGPQAKSERLIEFGSPAYRVWIGGKGRLLRLQAPGPTGLVGWALSPQALVRLEHEVAAKAALRSLHSKLGLQRLTRELKKKAGFPAAETVSLPTSRGYLLLLRVAPDRSSWIALAVPEAPGKSGRYYYLIDPKGRLYRSTKPIELKDNCVVPKGLEPAGS